MNLKTVGIVAAVLVVGYAVLYFALSMNEGEEPAGGGTGGDLTAEIAASAAQLNANAPQKIDEATTLVRVTSEGVRLKYLFEIKTDDLPGMRDAMRARVPASVRRGVCASPDTRGVVNRGGEFLYRYRAENGEELAEFVVTAADCDG